MKRDQLIRQLRKDAKTGGLELLVEQVRGKGSHYVARLGNCFAVIQSGEISPPMERTIRKQLGL